MKKERLYKITCIFMTKYEIICQLAYNEEVEKIVYKLLSNSKNQCQEAPKDLIQDIYEVLLTKPDDVIEDLYRKNELGYFILKIAKNQIFSVNSKYFYLYIKHIKQSDDISAAANIYSTEED